MQPNNRSSFIPKKSIKRVERSRGGNQLYLLSYVAYAIFFATLLATAAVFFYANLLNNTLTERIAELDAQRVAFSQGEIARIKEAERRFKLVDYLFSKHVSSYAIFNEIEQLAVEGVIFSTFTYQRSDPDTVRVSLEVGSDRFDSAAFQNRLLRSSDILAPAILASANKAGSQQRGQSAVDEEESGFVKPVTFGLELILPTEVIEFSQEYYEFAIPEPENTTGTFGGGSDTQDGGATGTDQGDLDNADDI